MDQIDVDKIEKNYKNQMIRELKSEQDFIECAEVIRKSFKTVADEFNLNQNNAPSHPSNLAVASLIGSVEKGVVFYGLHIHEK